jgi:four helix bundle protein
MQQENFIVNLTFQFALDIVSFCEILEQNRKYNLANQLFRSGTSVGANVREAQGAESKSDFIHKMKIAYKESEETKYWLELCKASPLYPDPENLMKNLESIQKVIGKIITTSKS